MEGAHVNRFDAAKVYWNNGQKLEAVKVVFSGLFSGGDRYSAKDFLDTLSGSDFLRTSFPEQRTSPNPDRLLAFFSATLPDGKTVFWRLAKLSAGSRNLGNFVRIFSDKVKDNPSLRVLLQDFDPAEFDNRLGLIEAGQLRDLARRASTFETTADGAVIHAEGATPEPVEMAEPVRRAVGTDDVRLLGERSYVVAGSTYEDKVRSLGLPADDTIRLLNLPEDLRKLENLLSMPGTFNERKELVSKIFDPIVMHFLNNAPALFQSNELRSKFSGILCQVDRVGVAAAGLYSERGFKCFEQNIRKLCEVTGVEDPTPRWNQKLSTVEYSELPPEDPEKVAERNGKMAELARRANDLSQRIRGGGTVDKLELQESLRPYAPYVRYESNKIPQETREALRLLLDVVREKFPLQWQVETSNFMIPFCNTAGTASFPGAHGMPLLPGQNFSEYIKSLRDLFETGKKEDAVIALVSLAGAYEKYGFMHCALASIDTFKQLKGLLGARYTYDGKGVNIKEMARELFNEGQIDGSLRDWISGIYADFGEINYDKILKVEDVDRLVNDAANSSESQIFDRTIEIFRAGNVEVGAKYLNEISHKLRKIEPTHSKIGEFIRLFYHVRNSQGESVYDYCKRNGLRSAQNIGSRIVVSQAKSPQNMDALLEVAKNRPDAAVRELTVSVENSGNSRRSLFSEIVAGSESKNYADQLMDIFCRPKNRGFLAQMLKPSVESDISSILFFYLLEEGKIEVLTDVFWQDRELFLNVFSGDYNSGSMCFMEFLKNPKGAQFVLGLFRDDIELFSRFTDKCNWNYSAVGLLEKSGEFEKIITGITANDSRYSVLMLSGNSTMRNYALHLAEKSEAHLEKLDKAMETDFFTEKTNGEAGSDIIRSLGENIAGKKLLRSLITKTDTFSTVAESKGGGALLDCLINLPDLATTDRLLLFADAAVKYPTSDVGISLTQAILSDKCSEFMRNKLCDAFSEILRKNPAAAVPDSVIFSFWGAAFWEGNLDKLSLFIRLFDAIPDDRKLQFLLKAPPPHGKITHTHTANFGENLSQDFLYGNEHGSFGILFQEFFSKLSGDQQQELLNHRGDDGNGLSVGEYALVFCSGNGYFGDKIASSINGNGIEWAVDLDSVSKQLVKHNPPKEVPDEITNRPDVFKGLNTYNSGNDPEYARLKGEVSRLRVRRGEVQRDSNEFKEIDDLYRAASTRASEYYQGKMNECKMESYRNVLSEREGEFAEAKVAAVGGSWEKMKGFCAKIEGHGAIIDLARKVVDGDATAKEMMENVLNYRMSVALGLPFEGPKTAAPEQPKPPMASSKAGEPPQLDVQIPPHAAAQLPRGPRGWKKKNFNWND
ncbi:MAG: hypothetical protein LBB14_01175 [Puniceicoccales bacterium]|nr:hypothetical protein [Puniceicoccales bacterium]